MTKAEASLRILFGFTVTSTILLEVVDQSLAVVSKVAEVNSLSSRTEKEETVEYTEEFSRRLMDSERINISRLVENQ